MRAREFLVEYDRNKTGQALGNQLLQAAQGDRTYHGQDDINQVLAQIEQKDPTPNKEYTTWLARMYSRGDVPMDDLNRNDWLGVYNQAKKRRMVKPEHADIGRFKSYGDFEDAVSTNYDPDAITKNKKADGINKGESRLYFENSDVRIIIPEDQAAAIYYGQGTKWCTAATRGQNYFDDYNEDGPLFIILFKKSPDKWQFHFETASFMDAQDRELKPNQVQQVSKYFGDDLWKAAVKENGYVIRYIANPSEAMQLAAVEQNGLAIDYIKNPSEEVQVAAVKQYGLAIKYIKNPSEAVQLAAVKQGDGYAIQYIKNPSEAVQMAAVKQYGYAIQYIKNPSEEVQLAAVREYGDVIQYIANPSEKVRALAAMRNKRWHT